MAFSVMQVVHDHVSVNEGESPMSAALPTMYVDLDGTLIATDLLHESSLQMLRNAPHSMWRIPTWLMRGKAFMKRRIAERP